MTTVEIVDRLQQLTADLLWMSESDYPFEVMTWEHGMEIDSISLFGDRVDSNLSIATITLADFFAPAITIEDWYTEVELAQVDRYTELVDAIESNLQQVQVFRIGEIEITVYIVGKTIDGDLVGLKTQIVET